LYLCAKQFRTPLFNSLTTLVVAVSDCQSQHLTLHTTPVNQKCAEHSYLCATISYKLLAFLHQSVYDKDIECFLHFLSSRKDVSGGIVPHHIKFIPYLLYYYTRFHSCTVEFYDMLKTQWGERRVSTHLSTKKDSDFRRRLERAVHSEVDLVCSM